MGWKISEYREAIETISYGLKYFEDSLSDEEVRNLTDTKRFLEGEMKSRILDLYGNSAIWRE